MITWHIVGSDGFIGSRLIKGLPSEQSFVCYSPLKAKQTVFLDLTSKGAFDLSKIHEGDFVVFLAAISSPDICDSQYDLAYAINVEGTRRFIEGCIQKKSNVLFFSSDAVNGSTSMDPVDEDYVGAPVGKYGQMKRLIEQTFVDSKRFKTFRLSYVFSKEDKFTSYLCKCDQQKETADVYNALYRSVIYREDILEAIPRLSQTYDHWDNSIFNLSGPELLSRKDLAALYKRTVSSDFNYSVSNPSETFLATHPNIISTRSLYLEKLLGHPPTSIEVALRKEFSARLRA